MNSRQDPLALPVIKQEFDDDLISSVEGWSPLTGNITTNSSRTLSTTTTQSGENPFSPTATTSNDSTPTTTTPFSNQDHTKTNPSFSSVLKIPKIVHQGQVKKLERNNNRSFLANSKFAQNGSIVRNENNNELLLNFEFQLKTQKQLKELTEMLTETRNAKEIHEKKYDELKLDYCEFKTNVNIKLDKLRVENDKLHDELNRLKESRYRNEKSTDISSVNQSSESNIDEVMIPENELIEKFNLDQDLDDDDDEMSNTTIDKNDYSIVESIDPSTRSRRLTNLIASKPPTGPNFQNLTKRKQSQPNRTVKKCKKTIGDNKMNESLCQFVDKIKLLYLNCTEQNCKIKLNSMKHLQKHLPSAHILLPFRCFAQNCNMRFGNNIHTATHLKLHHSKPTKFVCPVCGKEYDSQRKAYRHWNQIHLTGQFQCNLNQCNLVFDTRSKLDSHQQHNHCPQSKLFKCQHDGCSATFPTKRDFERHLLVHVDSKPFNCKWPKCSHRTNRRELIVRHIRSQHFGLSITIKEQKEKNIVEECDPNDYFWVVEDKISE